MTNETHNTNQIDTTKPRRWFRFRLRTLLFMVTLLSVPLGWVGWELEQRRREKTTIAWVEEMRGRASSNDSIHSVLMFGFYLDERSWWEKRTDNWFGKRVLIAHLNNTLVSDLSPLSELKKLKWLNLDNMQVSDLSPLAELKNLEYLGLNDTKVNDLSPLSELRKLQALDLETTQVNDLSSLTGLKNLGWLNLNGTEVSDLSPLTGLKNLEYLDLRRSQVSDEQVEQLRLALPNCEIEFYGI